MRALLALALLLVSSSAMAQSRYDHDSKWIRDTLREERRAERRAEWLEERHERRQRYFWLEHTRRYGGRYHARRDAHPETRVYGMTIRGMTQVDTRDCRNGCCPPVENISKAHSSESAAWNDAQLGWMKAISVRFGAMYADVQNADERTIVRQCFRCEFNEDWISRNREALAQNTGTGNGFKSCCRIIARACIQPIQGADETPLKGDKAQ